VEVLTENHLTNQKGIDNIINTGLNDSSAVAEYLVVFKILTNTF